MIEESREPVVRVSPEGERSSKEYDPQLFENIDRVLGLQRFVDDRVLGERFRFELRDFGLDERKFVRFEPSVRPIHLSDPTIAESASERVREETGTYIRRDPAPIASSMSTTSEAHQHDFVEIPITLAHNEKRTYTQLGSCSQDIQLLAKRSTSAEPKSPSRCRQSTPFDHPS